MHWRVRMRVSCQHAGSEGATPKLPPLTSICMDQHIVECNLQSCTVLGSCDCYQPHGTCTTSKGLARECVRVVLDPVLEGENVHLLAHSGAAAVNTAY